MSLARIGLIGDVHAEHDRLLQAISTLLEMGAEHLVCTGDIVDGSGCPNRCIELLETHKVTTVKGNHDRWILEGKARHIEQAHDLAGLTPDARAYLNSLPAQAELDTVDGKLLLCHGIADNDLRKVWPGTPRMDVERCGKLDDIIQSARYRYLVNGHMHFRTMIHFEALTLINAGTLRGEHWPGFSMLDLEQGRIFACEIREAEVRPCQEHNLAQEAYEVFGNTQDFRGDWEPVRLF